ncbi:putative membrane protein [Citrobacter rodentium ICC168]|uniref:Membrane protein n=1 Tax=Citrobacter rodentium (strain ICC168) TaxID=637910 RepID=D2TGK5_CITRI|nr:putative membrane protein [Citrobacter rodentium ICC168]
MGIRLRVFCYLYHTLMRQEEQADFGFYCFKINCFVVYLLAFSASDVQYW